MYYRVFHIETYFLNQLWNMQARIFFEGGSEILRLWHLSVINQFKKK